MKLCRRICFGLLIFFIVTILGFVGVGYINYIDAVKKVSIDDKFKEIKNQKNFVAYDDVNELLFKATISIEDRRFYKHKGIEYRSMFRALIDNIFAKGIVGGGSTITQQLAKNLYFTNQPSIIRKISEMFLAYDIEKTFRKKEIIEAYVNIINYGDGYIGIKKASNGYFSKEPKYLTLEEATLLAGIPQSPVNFQLSNRKKEALYRQKQVLNAMLRDKKITKSEMEVIENKRE